MHRRTSKSLFANRPARRAAHARLKAERVSQRSAERVYAMQRKRESRVQRWRQAFPTRFVPVNLSRFSALWAAVLSLFTDVLKAPTNRRRASAGFRARTSGLGFFQPLEERAMLAADVYVDDSADFTITNDIGDAGLSAGDEVTWLVGTASEQPNLIFGTDAFDSIQAGIAGVSAAGTVHVAPGEYESPVSTVGADIGAIDGETVAGDRAILKTPVGSPATLLTNDASLTLTDLTLRASNSGDTLFSNSGTLAFGASNEIEIAVDESNVGTPTSFAITIDGSAITSLIAGDTKGSVSAAGATITYTPVNTVEGPDTATFSFATNDGTSGVVDVVINAVNDAPVVTAGGGASPTFTEGGAAVVVDAGVTVSDVDDTMIESAAVAIAAGLDADDLLTVTAALPGGVTTSYAAGVLTISGTATVAEYETLLQSVTFENTGGNPASVAASRVIEFKVNDGDVDSLAASAGVAIDAVNDAPVEEKVGDDTVVEGGTTQIHGRNNDGDVVGSSDLVFSDVDDAETDIVYEIVSVTNGTLRIGGGAYGSGALLGVGDTFTQDDLNSATGNGSTRVRFDHDGSETASAGFTFIVRDAAGAESADANATTPGEFLLTVTPDNDAPVVAVNDGLTVTEGDLDTSLAGTLGATDVDDTDAGLVYTIASVPANGTLKLSGTPLAASDTFTQAQLDAGDVTYSQETPNQPSDSFTFTVMDDDNAATVVATYDITINQVNDPLSITTNLGLTVVEGGSQSLNTRLDTTDADTADADIVYTVTSGPANGSLSLTSFTQAQLDAGDVTYSHNGGETTSDSFAFDVTDGLTVLSSAFAVSVTPVNDTPVVTAPTDIVATQEVASVLGGTFSITDADIPGQTLTATLSVSNGALAVPGTPTDVTVGGTPTALTLTGTAAAITAALNGGEVTYTGDPGVAGDDADLLTIDVSDGTATGSTTANLDIVDVNDPPTFDPLVDQVATEDDPTQTVAGFLANVDTIESGQGYTVSVSNDNTSLFTAGGQPTIDKATGDLTYTPAPDAFGTAVVTVTVTDDGVGTTGGSNSTSQTFEIEVTGVDEPPVVTTNPLTINEGDTVTLTTSKLSVTDPETPAADLDITATSVPAGLQLELASAPGTAITTFTYEQLQLGQVKVVDLDPAGLIGSAAIDFEVTDGTAATATPVSASLTVNVTPVNDAPVVDNSSSTAATFTEGGAAVAIADAITITDVDNTELVSATIAITDPVAGDLLTVGGLSGSITVDLTDDGSNGVLKLIGPGTLAEFAATIAMIEFSSSSSDPTVNDTQTTRSISVQVDDGAASDNLGSTTISVGVTAVNDAPVLASANDGQTLTFTEEQPAVTLFGDLSIADDDGASERFESATLTITNFQSGQDVVSFAAVAGLTVVLDDTTTPGVMVVSVTSDAANTVEASAYETLLQSIAFENTSDAPVTAPNRGVTLIVNDGDDDSNTLTAAIEVVGENDAPEVTTGSVTIAEGSNNANSNYITPALLSVTDADGVDPATIVYTLTEILNGDGVTANTGLVQLRYRDGSSDTMILGVGDTFTQADINSWSEGASTGAGDNVGLRVRSFGADATTTAGAQATLKFSVDLADPGAPLAVDFVVGITPVNDVPSAGGSPGTVTLDEKVDDVEVPQDITGFTHTDEETTDSGTLTIKVTGISTGETLGTLLINGSPYMAGVNETLTQAQANSGGLQYVHTSDDQPVGGAEVTVDYQVLDADGGVRNGRSFDIAFTPQNDSPIAVDDTFTGVFEDDGNATLGNVLAANPTDADADPEGGALTVTKVNGEAADVGSEITLPSGALLTLNANGTFDYNPNGAFEDLAGGEPGSDTFTYQVTDPDSGVGAATVTVIITGQNDLPVVTAGLEFDLAENSGVGAEVGAVSATDIDAIDTIADFMITGGDAGFAIDSSGLITTTTDFDFESVGSPTLTVMVAAQDSFGAWSNPVLVTISLLDINDLPSVDTNAGLTVLEGGSGSLATKLSASDDEDASADLIYTVATGPANGSLSLTTFTQADVDAGLVIYSHDGGETVTDSFTFTVEDLNDPAGVTTEQTFSITVTPVNDAPVATPNPLSITVDKDSTITFDALAIVDAIEGGQVVTLTGVGSTSAGGSSVLASLGTGMITYTPNGSVGTDTFTYTVMDNGGTANGGADTATVTVNVTIEDLAPDAQDDDAVVTEGGMVTVDLFADNGNGVDVSGQAGAPTITEVAGVAFTPGMSVTLSGGTLTHVPGGSGGEFEYQSDLAEEISEEVFQYTISDGTTPDTATVTIDVTDVADVVPFIASLSGDTGGSEGDTLSFTVVATDGDSDPVLTYDWDFGDGTQVFGVTASESHTYTEKGNYTVTVTVSDRGQSASASAGVSIIDDVAPEVASVRVGSLDWSTSFVDFVDASMGLGYSVTEGEAPLPWVNLDVIHVTFSEEVQKIGGGTITVDDIQLIGVNNVSPSIASFSYDNSTFTATITLFDPIGAEKLLVYVDGSDVEDDAGNSVDGSDSTRIDIVPGDANRSSLVSPTDLGFANGKKLLGTGDAGYSIYADVNGSGTVTGTDVNDIRLRQFSALPSGSPVTPAPAPAAAPVLTASPISVRAASVVEAAVAPASDSAASAGDDSVLLVLSGGRPTSSLSSKPALAQAPPASYEDQSLLLYLQDSASLTPDAEVVEAAAGSEDNETEEERDEAIGQLFGSAF